MATHEARRNLAGRRYPRSMRALVGRQAAGVIVVVAVVAALLLLAILPGLQGPGAQPTGTASAPASPGATNQASAVGSGGPGAPTAGAPVVFVGAGDIAVCGSDGDAATAALLDGIEGTVFVLG